MGGKKQCASATGPILITNYICSINLLFTSLLSNPFCCSVLDDGGGGEEVMSKWLIKTHLSELKGLSHWPSKYAWVMIQCPKVILYHRGLPWWVLMAPLYQHILLCYRISLGGRALDINQKIESPNPVRSNQLSSLPFGKAPNHWCPTDQVLIGDMWGEVWQCTMWQLLWEILGYHNEVAPTDVHYIFWASH